MTFRVREVTNRKIDREDHKRWLDAYEGSAKLREAILKCIVDGGAQKAQKK